MQPSDNDGGDDITSYELYMDLGSTNSAFSPVASYVKSSFLFAHTVLISDGLSNGLIYSFKRRSLNIKGASSFSDIIQVSCNAPPSQAPTPQMQ
jgi:hypothetical protein